MNDHGQWGVDDVFTNNQEDDNSSAKLLNTYIVSQCRSKTSFPACLVLEPLTNLFFVLTSFRYILNVSQYRKFENSHSGWPR